MSIFRSSILVRILLRNIFTFFSVDRPPKILLWKPVSNQWPAQHTFKTDQWAARVFWAMAGGSNNWFLQPKYFSFAVDFLRPNLKNISWQLDDTTFRLPDCTGHAAKYRVLVDYLGVRTRRPNSKTTRRSLSVVLS